MVDRLIQLRNDSSGAWDSVNPILFPGEFGVETNTGLFKVGPDSATPWNSLEYPSDPRATTTFQYKKFNEPIVLLAVGQSNMLADSNPPVPPGQGTHFSPSVPLTKNPRVWDWSRESDGTTFSWRVVDPNEGRPTDHSPGDIAVGYLRAGLPHIGYLTAVRLQEMHKCDVYLCTVAKDGAYQYEFFAGGGIVDAVLHPAAVDALTALQTIHPGVGFYDAFIYLQGTNEAFFNSSASEWAQNLVKIRDNLSGQYRTPVLSPKHSQTICCEIPSQRGLGLVADAKFDGFAIFDTTTGQNNHTVSSDNIEQDTTHFTGDGIIDYSYRIARTISLNASKLKTPKAFKSIRKLDVSSGFWKYSNSFGDPDSGQYTFNSTLFDSVDSNGAINLLKLHNWDINNNKPVSRQIKAGDVISFYKSPTFPADSIIFTVYESPLDNGTFLYVPGAITTKTGTISNNDSCTTVLPSKPRVSDEIDYMGNDALASPLRVQNDGTYSTTGLGHLGQLSHNRPYFQTGTISTTNTTPTNINTGLWYPEQDESYTGTGGTGQGYKKYMLRGIVSGQRTDIAPSTADHTCFLEYVQFCRSTAAIPWSTTLIGSPTQIHRVGNDTPVLTFVGSFSSFYVKITSTTGSWRWSGTLQVQVIEPNTAGL